MKLFNKSGPAIFMYSIIAITAVTSIICFYMYYGKHTNNQAILWIGITAFTIMYHFLGTNYNGKCFQVI